MDDCTELSSELSSVPSSPLSMLECSPSPPPEGHRTDASPSRFAPVGYPSPPASQSASQTGSPTPESVDADAQSQRPAKRRRISKEYSKERTTEHLELGEGKLDAEQRVQLDRLLHVLHKKQKIVVVAGAGISVSAGIPDFRSSGGLFKSLKDDYKLKGSGKDLFDASVYKDDSSTSSFHDMVSSMSRLTKDAKPTAFHHMLATIAHEGRLLRLYTQNVDGIDTSLDPLKTEIPLRKNDKGKWPTTVQLHGGLTKMVCSKCHQLSPLDADLFEGPVPPMCRQCEEFDTIRTHHQGKRSHGIGRLRPRMVLYSEHNPDDEAIGAVTKEDLRKRPDAVIVVGTTLKVPGVRRIVREMCGVVRDRRGGVTVWINNDPPPVSKDLQDCWDIIVKGRCDEVAKRAAMRKFNDPVVSDAFTEVTDEEAEKTTARTLCPEISPIVSSPVSQLVHLNAEPLPSPNHRNNSFPPVPEGLATPRKNKQQHAPAPSPLSTRKLPIIHKSIEDNSNADGADDDKTLPTCLPTPTKSQKSSPPLPALLAESKSTTIRLAAPKPAKPTKAARKPRAQTKSKPKSTALVRSATPLSTAFKQTKSTTLAPSAKSIKLASAPTKLRHVVSLPAMEPMHPVSPADHRNNSGSPVASINCGDLMKTTNDAMRIQNLINP
jgi:NAD-dependent histone deacetylase SIR2